MNDELLYRVAIRNDKTATITYRRGKLANILKFLLRQHGGVLDLDADNRIYLVPATHRMPWEIPPEEQIDANLKAQD